VRAGDESEHKATISVVFGATASTLVNDNDKVFGWQQCDIGEGALCGLSLIFDERDKVRGV
jgi:hypothetical protein